MSDVGGLEEFGGIARWRDAVLRFPDGHIEAHRLVTVGGRLPHEFKRPLDEARTAYETFILVGLSADGAVYEWTRMDPSSE